MVSSPARVPGSGAKNNRAPLMTPAQGQRDGLLISFAAIGGMKARLDTMRAFQRFLLCFPGGRAYKSQSHMNWLYKNWPYAAIFTAGFLFLLTPFFYTAFGLPFTLLYLMLPMYQVHQFEEHCHDRFRLFINNVMMGGIEALTVPATFWINCLGVWVLDFVLFYPAFHINLGWGLGIVYVIIINAITHIMVTVRKRVYNPGVITSVTLFLPLGIWTLHAVTVAAQATWVQQGVGLAVGIVTHILILVNVLGHRAWLLAAKRAA